MMVLGVNQTADAGVTSTSVKPYTFTNENGDTITITGSYGRLCGYGYCGKISIKEEDLQSCMNLLLVDKIKGCLGVMQAGQNMESACREYVASNTIWVWDSSYQPAGGFYSRITGKSDAYCDALFQ